MSRAADLLQTRAEVLMLARLLDRDPGQLAYLEPLPAGEVRALRDAITEALHRGDGSLHKLAAASRLLPAGLTATIGQHAFGPLLSARLAGLLDPGRAADVAGHLPPPFLAQVAVELDPRRASDLIGRLSPTLVGEVTAELVSRAEHVTMGRFVGHLSDEAIAASLEVMDDRMLLEVAFVLEDKDQLSRLLSMLPEERAAGIIAAAAENGLWVQALDLLNHLTDDQRHAMVVATLGLHTDALDSALNAIVEHDLWDEMLLIAEHDASIQDRLAHQLRTLPVARRRTVAERAEEHGALGRLGLVAQALTA